MRPEAESIVDEITELFRHLSAAERRVLQRRLRLSGLIELEEPVADRNRVEVATALGVEVVEVMALSRPAPLVVDPLVDPLLVDPSEPSSPVRPVSTEAAFSPDADVGAERDLSTGPPNMAEAENGQPISSMHNALDHSTIEQSAFGRPEYAELDEPTEYQSAVSGKVVVGTPDSSDAVKPSADPHMMLPLPGQAPEQPILVVFEGGSKGGDPGVGYGSYELDWPGLPRQVVQLQFGDRVTHNEAEYDTLIAALEGIMDRLEDQDADPATAQIDIRGNAELVIGQVRGDYPCESSRIRLQRDRAIALLDEFEEWNLIYQRR